MKIVGFDYQTSATVRRAYDEALTELELRHPRLDEAQKAVIKTRLVSELLRVAEQGKHDPNVLRAAALDGVRVLFEGDSM